MGLFEKTSDKNRWKFVETTGSKAENRIYIYSHPICVVFALSYVTLTILISFQF